MTKSQEQKEEVSSEIGPLSWQEDLAYTSIKNLWWVIVLLLIGFLLIAAPTDKDEKEEKSKQQTVDAR